MVLTENQEQAALFEWAAYQEGAYPELRLLHAIPNGGYRPPKTAAMLKETGLKPGVPDVCLPVARGRFHGLYIEMKRKEGWALSPAQRIWMNLLRREGYKSEVCLGFESARELIIKYLEGNHDD